MTSRPLRVLVVGEKHDTVVNIGILLRSEGIDVRLVEHGMEDETMIVEFRPDAVLLDPEIPQQRSVAVAKELMRLCGEHLPVLLYVKKPIDLDALLKRVLAITPK
jgi:DNA-binding response OmpR family regulator